MICCENPMMRSQETWQTTTILDQIERFRGIIKLKCQYTDITEEYNFDIGKKNYDCYEYQKFINKLMFTSNYHKFNYSIRLWGGRYRLLFVAIRHNSLIVTIQYIHHYHYTYPHIRISNNICTEYLITLNSYMSSELAAHILLWIVHIRLGLTVCRSFCTLTIWITSKCIKCNSVIASVCMCVIRLRCRLVGSLKSAKCISPVS